jgi:hypothetical protein
VKWNGVLTPPQKGNDYAPLRYTLRKAASVHHAETRKLDTEKFAISLINSAAILRANVTRWFISACAKAITVRSPKGKNDPQVK